MHKSTVHVEFGLTRRQMAVLAFLCLGGMMTRDKTTNFDIDALSGTVQWRTIMTLKEKGLVKVLPGGRSTIVGVGAQRREVRAPTFVGVFIADEGGYRAFMSGKEDFLAALKEEVVGG